MTRHEAQALVIAAVGGHPWVRRIDYEVNPLGEGVVVTVADGSVVAVRLDTLAEMTVDEYREFFQVVQRNTERHKRGQAQQGEA